LKKVLNIGIVGAGSFAAFASQAFLQVDGVRVLAVSDISKEAGNQLANKLEAEFHKNYIELVTDKEIDLVYIATPPFLHYKISREALRSGKHVICEKPAALHLEEAEELQSLARESGLLYVVNLMQRYNPLYNKIKTIINEGILGAFLHGYFENYASDEYLARDHWFWKDSMSGGIFIEHGVHFFDMFSGWLGQGKVINAIQLTRPGTGHVIIDRVQATLLYTQGIVNFYHGFDQPKVLDRQEMKLQFERGDLTLYEWVPVSMKLHGILKQDDKTRLMELLEPAAISLDSHYVDPQHATGRFNAISYDDMVTIQYQNKNAKEALYQQLLRDMLTDQWQWIMDRTHTRVIDDNNAVESLRVATEAKQKAIVF
jgi:predicted dehydrogenase